MVELTEDKGLSMIGEVVKEQWFLIPNTANVLKIKVLRRGSEDYLCYTNYRINYPNAPNYYRGEGGGETVEKALENVIQNFMNVWKSVKQDKTKLVPNKEY